MSASPRKIVPIILLLAGLLLGSASFAQGSSFHTGSLEMVLDGAESAWHSYASHVPQDVAERATSPEQRAILEKVAGTDQHSATFMHLDGVSVGGVQITPAMLHVTMYFRPDGDPSTGASGVEVSFALDPETLELRPGDDSQFKFLPTGSGFDDYYALTQGDLSLEAVEVVDPQTLAIKGAVSGTLSLQEGYIVAHNPEATMSVEATFAVEQVVGSDVLFDLLSGD